MDEMIDLMFIFRSLYFKGQCYGNQFWAELEKLAYPLSFIAVKFRNGLKDRTYDRCGKIKWR